MQAESRGPGHVVSGTARYALVHWDRGILASHNLITSPYREVTRRFGWKLI
jgi:hypothetical protein